jgi:hypothetical protein
MTLSRDAILGASDIETETVDCPEWGLKVTVKSMTGSQRDAFEQSIRRDGKLDLRNARAKLLVSVIVNENGTRIFTDSDAPALGKKSAKVLNRLYEAAARLSGLDDDESAAIQGNSETDETADGTDSSSPSPETSE